MAVTISPAATGDGSVSLNEAAPAPSVATSVAPSNLAPSPWPDASHDPFAKNSTRNEVSGVLSSVPATATIPDGEDCTEVSTGKFCIPFGPASASAGSFGVAPSDSPRSIPSRAFPAITFPRTGLSIDVPWMTTPAAPLFAI